MLPDHVGCVYLTKPKGFKAKFEAVSCYLIYQSKVLFLLRSSNDRSQPQTWGVPTGGKKIKHGKLETDIEALLREIKEETGLDLKQQKNDFIYSNEFFMRYEKFDFVCRTYILSLNDKPIIRLSSEHQRFDWFRFSDVLHAIKLVAGLKEILTYYEKKLVHEIIKHKLKDLPKKPKIKTRALKEKKRL